MDDVVQQQPGTNRNNSDTKRKPEQEVDTTSYVDDDTHAREYCCCLHGWGTGKDPRCYYPWDKGVYRLMIVCCMMYCFCTFVPCMLCKKEYRDIVMCADQCGERDSTRVDNSDDDEIAVA